MTGFKYVCIGESRMILCKEEGDHLKKLGKAIKKAFPELFTFRKSGDSIGFLLNKFTNIVFCEEDIRIEGCQKMYSSQFDCQIIPLEKKNDWDKIPFVALLLIEKQGKTYCKAKPVEI